MRKPKRKPKRWIKRSKRQRCIDRVHECDPNAFSAEHCMVGEVENG